MKVLQFIRLLCLLGAFFIFPLSLYAMSTDLDNVKQLHLPARYLEGLREAQLKAKELHSIAFCMRAYPTEPFTDYQRQQLMETILRFEHLTWDIKRGLDKSLSGSDEILKHSLPPFDENGNLDRQNDVSFVYKSLFKNIPTKRTNHNRSTLEFIFNSSDKLHEMAYRSIVIYLSCFLKYVFCSEYPNPSNTPPLNPSIKDLEQLRNEKIAVSRQLTNLSESLLASLGFDFTYSGVPISMLTTLHLSDQSPTSFRATIRNYKTSKQLTADHRRDIYRWYSIKIERLKKVLCGFKAQISDVFDFLLNTEYLTNFTDVPVTPNGFLPRRPYITFEELLFKGFKITPQAIAYPVDVLTRVQGYLKSIWPNGAGKNTHMTSMGMLKLFCEIMEERAHLSIETNKRFLPNSLQSIAERYLNTPSKTHEVKIRSGKRSLKVFTTFPFEINLTNSFGASEEYEMSVFVKKVEDFATKAAAASLITSTY